jgi:lipopolysaccharide/colanic/teichoic acid biosynthesis glycosyltransferase
MIAESDKCATERLLPRERSETGDRTSKVTGPVPVFGPPQASRIAWSGVKVNPTVYLVLKRAADFFLAFLILVLTAPLLGLVSLLVKLTSRGPILYTQTRLGLRGRPFTIYKIRTMVNDCEKVSGPRWAALKGDPRTTLVGRFLRRTHIDELPQLWNVLCGDMSLIGPRPERPEFVPQLEQVIPHYRERLLVRPGMTGLAQVQLPGDTDLASVRRKLAYDLYYVQRIGFLLDLKLLLATACYIAKIPLSVTRWLSRLPWGTPVELAYEGLVSAAGNGHDKKAIG